MTGINRRSFMRSAALLTAAAGCFPWRVALAEGLDASDPIFEDGKFWVAELGLAADYGSTPSLCHASFMNGRGELMDEEKVYIRAEGSGKDQQFTVLSAICTHLKCKIEFNEEVGHFRCPCHKSEFSLEGEVVKKPAKRNLPDYSGMLKVEDGTLYLRRKAEQE